MLREDEMEKKQGHMQKHTNSVLSPSWPWLRTSLSKANYALYDLMPAWLKKNGPGQVPITSKTREA